MTTTNVPRSDGAHVVAASAGSRWLASTVFAAIVSAAAVLSFADSAPGLVRRWLRVMARSWVMVQDAVGVELLNPRDIPFEWDAVGHVVIWFAVAAAGWWILHRRVSAIVLATSFFLLSYAVEIGQSLFTTSRALDGRDLVANAVGIAVGTFVAWAYSVSRNASTARRSSFAR